MKSIIKFIIGSLIGAGIAIGESSSADTPAVGHTKRMTELEQKYGCVCVDVRKEASAVYWLFMYPDKDRLFKLLAVAVKSTCTDEEFRTGIMSATATGLYYEVRLQELYQNEHKKDKPEATPSPALKMNIAL